MTSATAGYHQLPNGYWIKDSDNSGPYVQTAAGVFAVAGSGGGGGGAVTSVAGRTGDVTLAQTDITANTPVAISNATTLTAATHANRQLRYSGTTATLTISADATGGWANDDSIEIHTLAGSAGVPTLATPDGKSVTGSATKIIGAVRKGTDVWTTGTTDPAAAASSSLPNIFDGQGTLSMPQRGSSTVNFVGTQGQGVAGTASGVSAAAFNGINFPQRTQLISATTTANSNLYCGTTSASEAVIVPGTGAGEPTARARGSFGVVDALSACRGFVGMYNATPSATVEPSTFLNIAGFGYDSTDTQISVYCNDGSGAVTKTAINGGAGFPCNTNTQDYYEWFIEIVPGATRTVNWYIKNLVSGVKASGSITTDVPVAGTAMRAMQYRNTAANTTAAVGIHYGAYGTGGWALFGATS